MLIARKPTRDEVRKVDTIRTAKLAAINELAAGVADEVNNFADTRQFNRVLGGILLKSW